MDIFQSLMKNLPIEILRQIAKQLAPSDLRRLALCGRGFSDLAIPFLYATLSIELGCFGASKVTILKLRTYQESASKRLLLRHILVVNQAGASWHLQSLLDQAFLTLSGLLLLQSPAVQSFEYKAFNGVASNIDICRALPSSIQVLKLEGSNVNTSSNFFELSHLSCTSITTRPVLEWVHRQIEQAPIAKLDLGLVCSKSLNAPAEIKTILDGISSVSTKRNAMDCSLSLHGFDISCCLSRCLGPFTRISLERCSGTEQALGSLLDGGICGVQDLTVQKETNTSQIPQTVCTLSPRIFLRTLRLYLGGCQQVIPVETFLPFKDTLQELVLDSRRVASIPETVFFYENEDLAKIVSICPKLRTLGLPIKLDSALRKYWVRYLLPMRTYLT